MMISLLLYDRVRGYFLLEFPNLYRTSGTVFSLLLSHGLLIVAVPASRATSNELYLSAQQETPDKVTLTEQTDSKL